MKIDFVLTASGNVALPRIQHAMFAGKPDDGTATGEGEQLNRVKNAATEIAAALSKAGYSNFTLYDVQGDTHHTVGHIRVEVLDPVATYRGE
jgi:hypothetical protein